MNATDALAELRALTAADTAPALAAADLDRLLAKAAVADAAGLLPSDPAWTPTYAPPGLRRAAAQGWREKAGRVSAEFDVEAGTGTKFSRSQKIAHCLAMAKELSRGSAATLLVEGSLAN